jgi:putative inorganic carbon (hco3(-)) transporter
MPDYRRILKFFPESIQDPSERIAFYALAGCVSLVLVSIAASQILLALAIAASAWLIKKRKSFAHPGIGSILPLVAFIAWTLIAIIASPRLHAGHFDQLKKFYLFLLIPMVPLIVRGKGRLKWIYKAVFLFAVISSLRGLAQFAADPHRDLLHRISGFMSQWMTYSGLLMLTLVLLAAVGIIEGIRRHMWVVPVFVCIAIALLLTQTRNAWIGAVAGITCLILMRRPRAFLILLVTVLFFYVASPGAIKDRVHSTFDTTDPRIHVWFTAFHVIQDNPWFGVGPKNVKWEAPKYREEREFPGWVQNLVKRVSNPSKYQEEDKEYPDWLYQHMHNNLLQVAAEIGIPGLLIWLWLMGRLGWDAIACYRRAKSSSFPGDGDLRKEALMASSAALASWVALMLAGLFEYNFGDSEVLILFLFIMSAPYAFTDSHFASQKDLAQDIEPETRKPLNA